eukprot:1732989-Pyramimonas_sp.AAC.5
MCQDGEIWLQILALLLSSSSSSSSASFFFLLLRHRLPSTASIEPTGRTTPHGNPDGEGKTPIPLDPTGGHAGMRGVG